MTALSVAQQVCLKVGLPYPSVIYSATERTWQEFGSLLNECATDIADAFDWQVLKKQATITGDGTTIGNALPSDYERMLRTANVWSSPYLWGMEHVVDTDRWLEYLVLPYGPVIGAWTIYDDKFQILPALSAGDTAQYFYISNLIVRPASGDDKTSFTADSDTFRLGEKLLQLCMTWKWLAKQGQNYAEALEDYNQELAHQMEKDGGSKPAIRGVRMVRGVRPAWPGSVIPWAG